MADCCSLFRKGCSTRQFGRGSLGAGSWLEPSQQLHVKRFVNSSRNCIRAKSCNPAVNVTTRRFRGLHNDCLYPGPIPNLLRCGLLGLHETCAGPSHRGTPLDLLVYALLDIPGPIANAHRLNSIPSLDRKRNATDENISIFPPKARFFNSSVLCAFASALEERGTQQLLEDAEVRLLCFLLLAFDTLRFCFGVGLSMLVSEWSRAESQHALNFNINRSSSSAVTVRRQFFQTRKPAHVEERKSKG